MYMAFDGMLDKDPNGGMGRNIPVDASGDDRMVSFPRNVVAYAMETPLVGIQKVRAVHCDLPYLPWQPLIQVPEMA
jgi:hypothetical protein